MHASVRVILTDDGGRAAPIETTTVNLSTSGALLASRPGLGDGPWRIQLFLPGEASPLTCTAELARRTGDQIGVAFADVSDADLLRLDNAVTGYGRSA